VAKIVLATVPNPHGYTTFIFRTLQSWQFVKKLHPPDERVLADRIKNLQETSKGFNGFVCELEITIKMAGTKTAIDGWIKVYDEAAKPEIETLHDNLLLATRAMALEHPSSSFLMRMTQTLKIERADD